MNDNWTKMLSPSPGGWKRLEARLEVEELSRKTELRAWAGVSAAMIGAFVFVASLEERQIQPVEWKERLTVENAQVVEREGTPPGIHFYWIFQK